MVERLTVDQVAAGSTPVTHPSDCIDRLDQYSAGFFTVFLFIGISIPAIP